MDPQSIPPVQHPQELPANTAVAPQIPHKPLWKNPWILIGAILFFTITTLAAGYYLGQKKHAPTIVPTQTQYPSPTHAIASPTISSNIQKKDVLNLKQLPLGDGKYGNTPKVGYIYSCQTSMTGGGAQVNGSWIHGNTWDITEKIAVQGSVTWPNATFTVSNQSSARQITGNGLPLSHTTGIFPIASTDPAYQIDKNPNSIKEQQISFAITNNPTVATTPSCVGGGMIGIALDGVAIFDGLDAGGRDAMAHEVQDSCNGHPQQQGEYHYHGPSSCVPHSTDINTLIGYALDGFGIYSLYGVDGKEVTNADLDICHGTTSMIPWNGKMVNMYHYVMTREYPYTIGCFKGTPIHIAPSGGGNGQMQGPPPF